MRQYHRLGSAMRDINLVTHAPNELETGDKCDNFMTGVSDCGNSAIMGNRDGGNPAMMVTLRW